MNIQIDNLIKKNNKVQISGVNNNYKLVFLPNITAFPNGNIVLNNEKLLECIEQMEGKIEIESGEGFNLKIFKINNVKNECDE